MVKRHGGCKSPASLLVEKMAKSFESIEALLRADEIMRICRTAVRKAQDENRRLGIANVYSFNGKRYYELPNGDYSRTAPGMTQGKVG